MGDPSTPFPLLTLHLVARTRPRRCGSFAVAILALGGCAAPSPAPAVPTATPGGAELGDRAPDRAAATPPEDAAAADVDAIMTEVYGNAPPGCTASARAKCAATAGLPAATRARMCRFYAEEAFAAMSGPNRLLLCPAEPDPTAPRPPAALRPYL